jgi:hypothetical protein
MATDIKPICLAFTGARVGRTLAPHREYGVTSHHPTNAFPGGFSSNANPAIYSLILETWVIIHYSQSALDLDITKPFSPVK